MIYASSKEAIKKKFTVNQHEWQVNGPGRYPGTAHAGRAAGGTWWRPGGEASGDVARAEQMDFTPNADQGRASSPAAASLVLLFLNESRL
ncbi:hypothetical protein PFLUV_G00170110 [Perca fluviatilis]|uniref:Uncharacterized protein n=1 Tax=Perca fluviatilis TaxID=8168 RepID=A0A6A5F1T1_PERFL|nr:hypothetical protein PFLUV_G00170110 [Perca fluviatilis]